MGVLTVVAEITAKKDCVDSLKAEVTRLVAPTRREEGCIEYRLHQDNDDPAVFLFYENWADAACLEKHMSTDRFKAYIAATEKLIERKAVRRMTCLL